jgi:tetratricopeptide (TPR) repeat protein
LKEEYNQAIADFSQSINLDPNFADTYYLRSTAYYYRGDYVRMIPDFEAAKRLNHWSFANDAMAIGGVSLDLIELSKTIISEPNAFSFYMRGSLNEENNQYDHAIADYTQAILLGEKLLGIVGYWDSFDQARVYRSRGFIYYLHKKDYNRAIMDFEAALRLDPDQNSTRNWLEQARQARGR